MEHQPQVKFGPCCFCGEPISDTAVDPCRVTLEAVTGQWQTWACHARCFCDRISKDDDVDLSLAPFFAHSGSAALVPSPPTTLGRILKVMPAVVLGLLLLAWAVSPFQRVGLMVGRTAFDFNEGSVRIWYDQAVAPRYFEPLVNVSQQGSIFGRFEHSAVQGLPYESVACPIPFVLTLLLPVAIGAVNGFRFRLWHFLAYTALMAFELAYYLRWQG